LQRNPSENLAAIRIVAHSLLELLNAGLVTIASPATRRIRQAVRWQNAPRSTTNPGQMFVWRPGTQQAGQRRSSQVGDGLSETSANCPPSSVNVATPVNQACGEQTSFFIPLPERALLRIDIFKLRSVLHISFSAAKSVICYPWVPPAAENEI
jgi:hypothetical protein